MVKQYAERDAYELDVAGDYYSTHISAMTREGLHGKSDIAAELAHRDMLIDQLKAQVEQLKSPLRELVNTERASGGHLSICGQLTYEVKAHVFKDAKSALEKTPKQCVTEVTDQAYKQGLEDCIDAAIDLEYLENDSYQCNQVRKAATAKGRT